MYELVWRGCLSVQFKKECVTRLCLSKFPTDVELLNHSSSRFRSLHQDVDPMNNCPWPVHGFAVKYSLYLIRKGYDLYDEYTTSYGAQDYRNETRERTMGNLLGKWLRFKRSTTIADPISNVRIFIFPKVIYSPVSLIRLKKFYNSIFPI